MAEVSVGELFVRLLVSLGVVIGIMWAAAWALKRMSNGSIGGPRGRAGRPVRIEVLARQSLGRRSSIAIVRAGDRGMVLGVTDTNVTLLVETSADELVIEEHPEAPRTVSLVDGPAGQQPIGPEYDTTAWRNITEALRERTVRRS